MADFRDRELGELLKNARRDAGLTQVQLAKAMGVRQGTVSRWEGGYTISDEYQEDLENILNIDLSPYMKKKEEEEEEDEWLPVTSTRDLSRYVISVARGVSHDEDLRMALTLLVKDGWLDQSLWMVMVSRDDLIEELGQRVFDKVWPKVLDSRWVERVSAAEYVLRLHYPPES